MDLSSMESRQARTRIGWLFAAVAAFNCADVAVAAPPPPAAPAPVPAPVPSSLEDLQKQVDLEKQKNTLLADLLASQKALIDAQKGAIDSQAALATSQKTLLDSTYPLITGGKTGAVTFDTANIGPLAQPGAIEALKVVADSICTSVRPKASSGVVLVNDADLKLIAQARWVSVQLVGLGDRYMAASPGAGAPVPAIGGSPLSGSSAGLALYGVGAALKEIASFTQLFRTDTTIYQATVKVDQETLTDAVAQCLLKVEPATAKAVDVFLPKSLLVASFGAPSSSEIQEKLKLLTELRSKGDAELGTLAGKTDDASKRRIALLTALNTSMDALVATLFTVSEKTPEPVFIGALAGEALLGKVGGGVPLLQMNLSNAAASGIKRSSIWRSDRLYSWSTITVNYALFDQAGKLLAAGTASNSPEPRKVVVEP
jgi:hypothetical protein